MGSLRQHSCVSSDLASCGELEAHSGGRILHEPREWECVSQPGDILAWIYKNGSSVQSSGHVCIALDHPEVYLHLSTCRLNREN